MKFYTSKPLKSQPADTLAVIKTQSFYDDKFLSNTLYSYYQRDLLRKLDESIDEFEVREELQPLKYLEDSLKRYLQHSLGFEILT